MTVTPPCTGTAMMVTSSASLTEGQEQRLQCHMLKQVTPALGQLNILKTIFERSQALWVEPSFLARFQGSILFVRKDLQKDVVGPPRTGLFQEGSLCPLQYRGFRGSLQQRYAQLVENFHSSMHRPSLYSRYGIVLDVGDTSNTTYCAWKLFEEKPSTIARTDLFSWSGELDVSSMHPGHRPWVLTDGEPMASAVPQWGIYTSVTTSQDTALGILRWLCVPPPLQFLKPHLW